jgi:hypothetical protein
MVGRSIGWSAGLWLSVCAGLALVVAYQLFTSFPLAPTVTALPRPPDHAAVDQIAA